MARCAACGERQLGTRFCGRCGALVGAGARRGTRAAAPRPAAARRAGPGPTTGAAAGTWRRLVGPAALGVVVLLIGVAVWFASSGGGSVADPTAADGAGTDPADQEVELPDDADDLATSRPDDRTGDGAGGDEGDGGGSGAPDPTGTGTTRFECLLDDPCGWEVPLHGVGTVEPWSIEVTDHDTVVVTGDEGFAVVGTDGQLRWSLDATQTPRTTVADDLVLALVDDRLLAFDGRIGAVRWSVDRPGLDRFLGRGATTSDRSTVLSVLAGSDADGGQPPSAVVQARNATDGTLRWQREAEHVELAGDVVVLADGGLEALDGVTGEQRWTADVDPRLPGHEVVEVPGAGLTAAGDDLLVAPARSPADPTLLLDAASGAEVVAPEGAIVWTSPARGSVSGPVVVMDDLAAGQLVALDAAGEVVWDRTYDVERQGAIAIGGMADTLLLDGGPELGWVALDVVDGSEVYRAAPSDDRTTVRSPFAEGVFAVRDGTDGSVTVVASDDTPLWRITDVSPQQVAADLLVFVVDDTLVGIAPDPRPGSADR